MKTRLPTGLYEQNRRTQTSYLQWIKTIRIAPRSKQNKKNRKPDLELSFAPKDELYNAFSQDMILSPLHTMPSVKIKTSSQGSASFNYVISTPSSTSAKSIDKDLPSILFIHPVYIASDVWHPQFADPQLRRFNLIALDLRAHGETGGRVTNTYGPQDAAEDIVKFMDALKLQSCYLAGLSMGTIIATQIAVSYPERVLGLFLISPLGTEEPPDVAEGRQEIYDIWVQGFPEDGKIDREVLSDAIRGALQLGFNNKNTSLTSALVTRTYPQAFKNWGKKNFDSYHTATVKFFVDRKSHPKAALSKIKGPVILVHCLQDVAYDMAYTDGFLQQLRDAGINVTLRSIDAAHFGCVTHPHLVDPLLHDLVAQNTDSKIPLATESVTSPFEADLIKAGYRKNDEDEDED